MKTILPGKGRAYFAAEIEVLCHSGQGKLVYIPVFLSKRRRMQSEYPVSAFTAVLDKKNKWNPLLLSWNKSIPLSPLWTGFISWQERHNLYKYTRALLHQVFYTACFTIPRSLKRQVSGEQCIEITVQIACTLTVALQLDRCKREHVLTAHWKLNEVDFTYCSSPRDDVDRIM